MKLFKVIVFIIFIFSQLSCEKIDLPRNNPLDNNTTGNNESKPKIIFSRFNVTGDNNYDNIINKGEDVFLRIYLKNVGTSRANKVRARISTNSPYITGLYPTTNQLSFDDGWLNDLIDVGEEKYAQYDFNGHSCRFKVIPSTPIGTTIIFNLSIEDEDGNSWSESFNITIFATGANIKFSRFTVTGDSNYDNKINKGEDIFLRIYLKNIGTSRANKVRANLSTNSPYITGLYPTTNQLVFNDGGMNDLIDIGEEKYAEYDFNGHSCRFKVIPSTPNGTTIIFNLSIEDEAGNSWSKSFSITVVATDANIKFSKYLLSGDTNNNGEINKGEDIYLRLYLKNIGTSRANKVRAILSTNSLFVQGLYPTTSQLVFNDGGMNDFIDIGEEKYAEYDFNGHSCRFLVIPSTPIGTNITFNMSITDESNNTWNENFNITVK